MNIDDLFSSGRHLPRRVPKVYRRSFEALLRIQAKLEEIEKGLGRVSGAATQALLDDVLAVVGDLPQGTGFVNDITMTVKSFTGDNVEEFRRALQEQITWVRKLVRVEERLEFERDEAGEEVMVTPLDVLPALTLWVDPGSAPSAAIADVLSDLSILYRRMGGAGINFIPYGINVLSPASP
jgi:hypothetical protein